MGNFLPRSALARITGLVVLTLALQSLFFPLSFMSQAQAFEDSQYFPETGHTVSGKFLQYWKTNGGLPVYGYPITDAQNEVDPETGKTFLTQWFERNRFELHPENAGTKFEVLMGLLGKDLNRARLNTDPNFIRAADNQQPGNNYFNETGHNLGGRFKDYWYGNGGLERFGYPISEEFSEVDPETGKTLTVQWFERARFEKHPENNPPYDVLLGLLGKQLKFPNGQPAADPSAFYALNLTSSDVPGSNLWSVRYGSGEAQSIASGTYRCVQPDANRLVCFQQVRQNANIIVQLSLFQLTDGKISGQTVLDSQLFSPLPNNANNSGFTFLAISPDGNQVAYDKANLSATPFIKFGDSFTPTELWVANLNPQNPAPKKLVNNDEDLIFKPVWNTDSSTIAFLRTQHLQTGAGYGTTIWTIKRDGSQLTQVSDIELGTIDGERYRAAPANDLSWISPTAFTFTAFDQIHSSLWLYDGSLHLLSGGMVSGLGLCDQVGVIAYLRDDKITGLFAVAVSKSDQKAVILDGNAAHLVGCRGDNIFYLDNTGQVFSLRINSTANPVNSKVKIGSPVDNTQGGSAQVSSDGQFVAVAKSNTGNGALSVFKTDGGAVDIKGIGDLQPWGWINQHTLVLISNNSQQKRVAIVAGVNPAQETPAVKQAQLTGVEFLTLITPKSGSVF